MSDRRKRREVNPYLEWDKRISQRLSLPLGVYMAAVNDPEFSFQAKMRTPLRVDFNSQARLILSLTWDLDELGSRRTFDGGNVMFEGRFLNSPSFPLIRFL